MGLRQFDRASNITLWVLPISGMIVLLLSSRLLDRMPIVVVSMILWLGPLVVGFSVAKTTWGKLHQGKIRGMFRWAAIALVGMLLTIVANQSLDKAPVTEIRTYVLAKSSRSSKGGPTYTLMVGPSWRAGRGHESLDVAGDIFSRAYVGETVSIDLHPGLFHLPWYNNVLPE